MPTAELLEVLLTGEASESPADGKHADAQPTEWPLAARRLVGLRETETWLDGRLEMRDDGEQDEE